MRSAATDSAGRDGPRGRRFQATRLTFLKTLVREAHRRSLWQVVGIYVAGSWVALQVVDLLVDNFALPEWLPPFALVLLVIGFPVVVATAFVQEGIGSRSDGARDSVTDGTDAEPAGSGHGGAAPTAAPGAPQRLFTWRNAIRGAVGASALWGILAAGWLLAGPGRAVEAGTTAAVEGAPNAVAGFRSIAVLPFATRSTREEDQYFAEGMLDDLLTQLSRIDSLTVISRTSVMQYAGTTKTIGVIAGELGVATVLEGGVQRAGDRVRVNVQLIDAGTDRHLWAEIYDEELTAENIFAIQSDLAREIAGALKATLSPAVAERIEAKPAVSLEAYDLYTRAQYAFRTRGALGRDIPEVRALFERAIAADSSYAPSWAGLANTYLAAWNWTLMTAEEANPPARAAVERALALDPDNTEARLGLARLLQFEGDIEGAERAVLRALELEPGSAPAHHRYSLILEARGEAAAAEAQARRAIELDPLDIGLRLGLADRFFFSARYEEALAESRRALEMEPNDWYGWYNVGWAATMLDRHEEAINGFREARRLAPDESSSQLGLAYAFAHASFRDSALHYMESAENQISYDVSIVYYELGDADRAFETLEAALRAEPAQLRRLVVDPSGAKLVADPRFDALVERLGLSADR